MSLKSEGFASNLFDPNGYSLKRFCAENGVRYGEYGVPVALETFVQYGLTFQRQLVPMVENTLVSAVERSAIGFTLRLESGGTVQASSVVVATGMSNTSYIPEVLTQLPEVLVSHSGDHGQLSEFRGRDVTVIGGGQSALETAALLHEGGANVRVVLRKRTVSWNEPPETRRQPQLP
jgi:cation diffusion facilitator CzcD-associated flavoprotein CzcO